MASPSVDRSVPARRVSRGRGATIAAATLGGASLAALQPVPFALLLIVFDSTNPTPSIAFPWFWEAPHRWAAVLAYTVTIATMLSRARRPSGGYVGAVVAASVAAYTLVGGVWLAVTSGDGAIAMMADAALSISPYGTSVLAVAIAAVTCWWARGFR